MCCFPQGRDRPCTSPPHHDWGMFEASTACKSCVRMCCDVHATTFNPPSCSIGQGVKGSSYSFKVVSQLGRIPSSKPVLHVR